MRIDRVIHDCPRHARDVETGYDRKIFCVAERVCSNCCKSNDEAVSPSKAHYDLRIVRALLVERVERDENHGWPTVVLAREGEEIKQAQPEDYLGADEERSFPDEMALRASGLFQVLVKRWSIS